MIPGGPLYVFSIGMGYTGEKLAKHLDRKLQKLEENDRFFMNGALRGAFGLKLGPNRSKNYAGFDYEVRFEPNSCFWAVLKDPDFSKNQYFFHFPGL